MIVRAARSAVGLETRLATEDRRVLEGEILPFFAQRAECRRILFVGCDWYTTSYEKEFAGREFWTIEIDPDRAKYGAAQHVTDNVVNLGRHFPEGHFDLLVLNGVLGWGLDDAAEAERALAACGRSLAPAGILLIGWNDSPEKKLVDPRESEALRSLERWPFPPLGTDRHVVRGRARHTYDFFRASVAR